MARVKSCGYNSWPGGIGGAPAKGGFSSIKIPAAAHDHEQRLECRVFGGLVKLQSGEVALAPVNVVKQAGGLDQFFDHLALARAQTGGVERHIDVLPLREA